MAGKKGMHHRVTTSPAAAEAIRARINGAQIAERLKKHVLGKVRMTPSQVTAGLGLLKKVMPDTQAIELTGKDGGPLVVVEREFVGAEGKDPG